MGTFYNGTKLNPIERCSNSRFLCTHWHSFKKYKTKILKAKVIMCKLTIIVGDFGILILITNRPRRQKCISRDIENLNNIINTTWHSIKTLQQTTAQYTFFSSSHGTVNKSDNRLGNKQVSISIKVLKSYGICFLITVE